MTSALSKNLFLVKEHVGLLKAASNSDIYDPETGELLWECREERLGLLTRLLRFTDYKRFTPFDIQVRTPEGEPAVRVRRGVSLFLSKVRVYDGEHTYLGGFQQKLFSIGGRFDVLDSHGQALCSLKGNWSGWNFRFVVGETELARVTKQWSGLGKELFTSADNYMLVVSEEVPPDNPVRKLILAAVMCIDMVLKE